MKHAFNIVILFLTLNLFGQDIEKSEWKPVLKDTSEIKLILDKFNTADSLNVLSELINNELVSYDNENPSPINGLKDLKRFEYLTSHEDENIYIYCLINIETATEYRASYIYLDGTKLDKTEIDSIRPIILREYKKGTSFEDLNEKYNMDPNPNKGDLGWFKDGQMMPVFEKAVREHKLNEIFTVDIPEKNWYYVTLKTFDNKTNEKRTYLKIKSSS